MTPGARVSAHRWFVVGFLCLGIAATAYGVLQVTLQRAALVHVTWANGVDDAMRQVAEQRYYMPVFALFMLFRESASPGVERIQLGLFVAISLYLFAGIVGGQSFL